VPSDDHVQAARAVFDASAEDYVRFAGTEIGPTTESAVDRALLAAFVELVGSGEAVADVGCGPGRVTALLSRHGLDVVGIDVSEEMVHRARRAHPILRFESGQLDRLPVGTASLGGAVAWYSIIYTPPEALDAAFRELARVIVDGGHLLLAFQAGSGEGVRRVDAFGTQLPLTSYRHDPADVARRLGPAGFDISATTMRARELEHEQTPQAFVLARRIRSQVVQDRDL
jgi:ubiquinone/menaquinone biosynthesis C-methylase UbiE